MAGEEIASFWEAVILGANNPLSVELTSCTPEASGAELLELMASVWAKLNAFIKSIIIKSGKYFILRIC